MTNTGLTEEFDLSALENPNRDPNLSKAQQLADAKAAIAGSTPLIPDAPNCIVQLPRGLFQGGVWKKEAEVRELTGADEEALSRAKESTDFFDLVLAHGVVRVDDLNLRGVSVSERQGVLRDLLVGERSQLLMAVIAATYGDEKTLNITCPHCSVEQEATLHLSEDFKPKEVDDITAQSFTYNCKGGDVVEYRLVTGGDQHEALKRKGATLAEQNSLILQRCIVRVNGQMVLNPQDYVRSMGMADRNKLLNEMVAKQPDLDLDVQTLCVGCGGDILLPLGWSDLFRP